MATRDEGELVTMAEVVVTLALELWEALNFIHSGRAEEIDALGVTKVKATCTAQSIGQIVHRRYGNSTQQAMTDANRLADAIMEVTFHPSKGAYLSAVGHMCFDDQIVADALAVNQ